MKSLTGNDTITAIATSPGESAIGIVRISGADSLRIAQKIFISKKKSLSKKAESHRIVHGFIIDSEKDEKVDEVLLAFFRAPRTYTGEDMIEISAHGSMASLRKILSLILKQGARIAEPGEFTRRAFLNGRIDLIQAESVLEIIRSRSEEGLFAAVKGLEGGLSQAIRKTRKGLVEILTGLEASFMEEEIEGIEKKDAVKRIKGLISEVKETLKGLEAGSLLKENPKIVIAGKPNAGKSSLFNLLLEKDRAIVSSAAGTTRDSIEDQARVNGVDLKILDTAGIRRGGTSAEKEGARRAVRLLQDASLVLFIADASKRLSTEDSLIARTLKDKDALVVVNKTDLKRKIDLDNLKKLFPGDSILEVSAKKKTGIENLKNEISKAISKKYYSMNTDRAFLGERQRGLLEKAEEALRRSIETLQNGMGDDLAAIDIRGAVELLDEATGDSISEEILERIFKNFCVGK
jgi:tRNA modification GTPase